MRWLDRAISQLPQRHRAPRRPASARFVLLAVALILAITLADWVVITMQRAAAVDDFMTATTNLANGMYAQTSRSLEQVDAALRDVQGVLASQQSAAQTQAALRSRDMFELLTDRLRALRGVDRLALVDAAGHLANRTGAAPAQDEDLSGEAFFRHFRDANDPSAYLAEPRRDPANGLWTIVMARRLRDAQGGFAGVATAQISLSALQDFYRTAMPAQRTILVVRRDGVMLLRYPDAAAATGQRIPANLPWYRIAAGGGGSYRSPVSAEGPPILAVMRVHPTLPVVIEVSVNESVVLAGWYRQRLWLIMGGTLACIAATLLVWLFASQIRRLDQRNHELDTARGQLDAALANISQGVCFFSGGERLIVCNWRFGEIYGLPPPAMRPGVSLEEIARLCETAGDTTRMTGIEHLRSMAAAVRGGAPSQSVIDLADGRTVAMQVQPMPDGGLVATHEDITQRRQAENQIAHLARHDTLTGLPNRALLMERIEQARVRAGRSYGYAVLFLDLDRFKAVNDTLGHAAGDELLRNVAARLQAAVREEDTVARLGGDEFVVLQAGLPVPEHAAVLAERIITSVGAPYVILGHEVFIGVSIGIATSTSSQTKVDDLLRNADLALYVAKAEGRGRFRFFEPAMDASVQSRHALERDLRLAILHGEFELHYRPIVSILSGTVSSFQVLLRWNHPQRGLLGAREIVAVAEECGLIVPIGEWMITEACREAAHWPEGVRVVVTLSPVQFGAASLVAVVRETLASAGLKPGRLELEITERVLLKGGEQNIAVMHELRECGARIVMGDFGVGYSSLSYLRSFPFERVTIDRSFVEDLARRPDAVYVVRAIIGLCANLGIRTAAEGVRTAEQLAMLLAEGCAEAQGAMFSEAVPAAQARQLIGARLIRPVVAGDAGLANAGARLFATH